MILLFLQFVFERATIIYIISTFEEPRAISLEPDVASHTEPPLQVLRCLQIFFFFFLFLHFGAVSK